MTQSIAATVLIPTHDHAPLLPYAIRSALAQTQRDFELFVVGDGANSDTRETVESFARSDSRVRYFDFPKGERHGELNRHIALQEAQGRIVAYLCDDDLWLEDHLATLAGALETCDFAHTLHTFVMPGGQVEVIAADIADPAFREIMTADKQNYFGPTVVGHTLAAYRALPIAWSPAPPDIWTDLHMWRKFFAHPGLRFATIPVIDTVHFPTAHRRYHTPDQRLAELDRFVSRLMEFDGRTCYIAQAIAALNRASTVREKKAIEARLAELSGPAPVKTE